jgi:elongation factor P
MISTNEFKNGMHISIDGIVYRIVEFQHVKPGKGGAFVRTKLKALSSGGVVDKTFRAGEKMQRVRTEVTNVTYIYNDGSDVVLMDSETFEQIHLPLDTLADELRFMRENDTVQLLLVDGKPTAVQLPASVELAVTETEPGVRGDTVSNVTKPATLETGAVVQVPMFVNVGETIKVDTREARYISRA